MEELHLANTSQQTEKVQVEEVRENLRRRVSRLSLDSSTSIDANDNGEKKSDDNKDENKSESNDTVKKKKPNDVARRISLSYEKIRKSISELEIDMSDDDSDTGDSAVPPDEDTSEDAKDAAAEGKRSYDVDDDDERKEPNNVARRISLSYQRLRESIDKFEDELASTTKMGSDDELPDS